MRSSLPDPTCRGPVAAGEQRGNDLARGGFKRAAQTVPFAGKRCRRDAFNKLGLPSHGNPDKGRAR
eukprot:11223984-Lingulodinium_polyedra.AAC.1